MSRILSTGGSVRSSSSWPTLQLGVCIKLDPASHGLRDDDIVGGEDAFSFGALACPLEARKPRRPRRLCLS
jgi:hypothetical protein